MDKPHIKLEARYLPNLYEPRWLLEGRYSHNGEEWVAAEFIQLDAYTDTKQRYWIYGLIVNALIERFNKESLRWHKDNTAFCS